MNGPNMTSNEDQPDRSYIPALARASEIMAGDPMDRLLLVGGGLDGGQGLPDGFQTFGESRFVTEPEVELPTGVYSFRSEAGGLVMLVTDGASPAAPAWDSRESGPSTALAQAEVWAERMRESAMAVPHPLFAMSDTVFLVADGREAQVRRRRFHNGTWSYSIRLGGQTLAVGEDAIRSDIVDDDPYEWISRPPGSVRKIAATLTRAKLRERLTDTVYSFRATRTIYRPYQFRPIIKLLRTGRHRLLIADEVGLGKTIEAGLIWTEFDARGQADRVLVVCPSMLVPKWRAEMTERFGYELTELDRAGLEQMIEQAEHDRLPPRFRAVCSLERLRGWSGLERMNDLAPRFDLIIVDEAHTVRNTNTQSHALACLLSDWAEALVFLSATPLNLGTDDLFNLLQLLEPGEFDDRRALTTRLQPNSVLNRLAQNVAGTGDPDTRVDLLRTIAKMTYGPAVLRQPEYSSLEDLLSVPDLSHGQVAEARALISRLHTLGAVVNRTRKADVDESPTIRQPMTVNVVLTASERTLYDAVHRWQDARAAARRMPLHFIGQMKLRLAGSCLPAMRDQILSATPAWGAVDLEGADPSDDHDPSDDLPPADVVEAARALGDVDTKYDGFEKAIGEIINQGRQVLVFSFSRPTVAYLEHRLSEQFRVGVLHGGVRSHDRQALIAAFRRGEYDVVVASRVASEGLDFEFCGAVVNYDLPWNPMEVEQRIGRIDRFGQEEEVVYVVNLHTPGTIESDIVMRVHQRIRVFEESIGALEPILGSGAKDLMATVFDFTLDQEQRDEKIEQMLTAAETKARIQAEVEEASAFLNVMDDAEIDGFEDEVLRNGRYVGQPELVWLLEDWASLAPGAGCRVSDDLVWVRFHGDATLDEHLIGVQAAGERSASEIAELSARLRHEMEILLCLDQETARRQGADLLGSTHPLVRAALRAPASTETRFGTVQVETDEVEAGVYLVLVGMARWNGLRPATEFWTAAADMDGRLVGEGPGDALLSALASASLTASLANGPERMERALTVVEDDLGRRRSEEGERRKAENLALVEARRISLRETHGRKVDQIHARISTLQRERKPATIPLFESQIRTQEHLLQRALHELDEASVGDMSLESLAVVIVEVA
jgi:superfamily II DNA or RNA helicase